MPQGWGRTRRGPRPSPNTRGHGCGSNADPWHAPCLAGARDTCRTGSRPPFAQTAHRRVWSRHVQPIKAPIWLTQFLFSPKISARPNTQVLLAGWLCLNQAHDAGSQPAILPCQGSSAPVLSADTCPACPYEGVHFLVLFLSCPSWTQTQSWLPQLSTANIRLS